MKGFPLRRITTALTSLFLLAGLFGAGFALAHGESSSDGMPMGQSQGTNPGMNQGQSSGMMMGDHMMPEMNPDRGRKLFVDKGCVACHAINGVGGHDATPLDAHTMQRMMNPFDFAAKMWTMAPAMIAAQEEALGEQVEFTGDELADIIAFVHNDQVQHNFTDSDLTDRARQMMDHGHGETTTPMDAHSEEIGHMHGGSSTTEQGHKDDGHTH